MADKFTAWKQHFVKQAKGLVPHEDTFYNVTTEKSGEKAFSNANPNVTLVSPVQQLVERAKNDKPETSTIYDPVTGVMRQSATKHQRVRKYSKKRGKAKKRVIKKGRVSKKRRKSKSKSKSKTKSKKNKTRKFRF